MAQPNVEQPTPNPNPSLKSLEVLAGEWHVELAFPGQPSVTSDVSFTWMADGAYLLMATGGKTPGVPWSKCMIGRDEAVETYAMLYYDWRGVSRIYQMSLDNREWKQWREAPGFWQRFIGTFSDDKKTISARWEKSLDSGSHWEHDFNLTYRKIN